MCVLRYHVSTKSTGHARASHEHWLRQSVRSARLPANFVAAYGRQLSALCGLPPPSILGSYPSSELQPGENCRINERNLKFEPSQAGQQSWGPLA